MIYAAVNISCVVLLLTVVLVTSNDSNKNEMKSMYVGGGGVADIIKNNLRGQPVTADTQTELLLYTAHSATCGLQSYVITDV